MRLTPQQVQLIRDTTAAYFGQGTRVWLFGSRLDDNRLGGDVDLYIETETPELLNELRCKIDLEEAVDLHVDLIVARPGDNRPIISIAKQEGIQL